MFIKKTVVRVLMLLHLQHKPLLPSYAIFHVIAKHSKSFTDGEFVKECLIGAVQSYGDSLTLEELASIPLSANIVKLQICKLYSFVLTRKIKIFVRILFFFFHYASMKAPR